MFTALLMDYRGLDPNVYIEKILDPIIKRLDGFNEIRILTYGSENVSFADQQEKDSNWQGAIRAWGVLNKRDVKVLPYDASGFSPSGPCEVWFKNIYMAFVDDNVGRIVYFPWDITYMVSTDNYQRETLQAFINQVNEKNQDLLLGTYEAATDVVKAREEKVINNFLIETTKAVEKWNLGGKRRRDDIPKNFLEDFTILELCSAFPESMKWFFRQRGDSEQKPKPRTGFFGLSRRLFDEFKRRPYRPTMMPWAGTVQLLICAAMSRTIEGNTTFQVAERFVSDLEEPPLSFNDYRVAHQRERIAYVIADERHYWTRQPLKPPL